MGKGRIQVSSFNNNTYQKGDISYQKYYIKVNHWSSCTFILFCFSNHVGGPRKSTWAKTRSKPKTIRSATETEIALTNKRTGRQSVYIDSRLNKYTINQ